MRAFNLVPLLFLPVAWSIPAEEFQEVLGELADLPELESIWADISTEAAHAAHAWTSVEKTIQKGEEKIEIPKEKLIAANLALARELEQIV